MGNNVTEGLSDAHNGGKTVIRLDLGSGHSVFYKPRSLATDVLLRSVLSVLCNNVEIGIIVPPVVERATYGWSLGQNASAHARSSANIGHAEALGQLLAVGYFFGMSDLHSDNVLLKKGNVIVVDTETIFNPTLPDDRGVTDESIRRTGFVLNDSVLRTGILPRASFPGAAARASERAGWDKTQFSAFVASFSDMFRHVANASEALLHLVFITSGLAGMRSRVVFRDTEFYHSARRAPETMNTDIQGCIRAKLLEQPWCRLPLAAIEHEVLALMRDDVPVFSSSIDRVDLACDGHLLVDHFFGESGLAGFRRRMTQAGERVLAGQVRFIHSRVVEGTI